MTEPKRITDINKLSPIMKTKVIQILSHMKNLGYDPVLFETLRTKERQQWLYGIGRSHSLKRKPVTWTMKSEHLKANAADIISKSKYWDWEDFYVALARVAKEYGCHTLAVEQCHVQLGD